MARDRGRGCPNRWRLWHSSKFGKPERPVACPCLWSDGLIRRHFLLMLAMDEELDLALHRLADLMWDSRGSP